MLNTNPTKDVVSAITAADTATPVPSPAEGSRNILESRSKTGVRPRQRAIRRYMAGLAGVAVAVVVFQFLPLTGIVSQETFPTASEDFTALIAALGTSVFWAALGDTLLGWAIALLIAVAVAVPLGVAIGAFAALDWASKILIEFLRPIPSVSLIPLAVLVFGISQTSAVFLAVFGSVWPILVHTIYGVKSVDPVATDTGKSFGFGRFSRLRSITLPSALPYIATGLRISAAISLVLIITAGLVIGSPGLGKQIALAQQSASYASMYGLILATGLLGWAANSGLEAVERRVLKWHTSHRATGNES